MGGGTDIWSGGTLRLVGKKSREMREGVSRDCSLSDVAPGSLAEHGALRLDCVSE